MFTSVTTIVNSGGKRKDKNQHIKNTHKGQGISEILHVLFHNSVKEVVLPDLEVRKQRLQG